MLEQPREFLEAIVSAGRLDLLKWVFCENGDDSSMGMGNYVWLDLFVLPRVRSGTTLRNLASEPSIISWMQTIEHQYECSAYCAYLQGCVLTHIESFDGTEGSHRDSILLDIYSALWGRIELSLGSSTRPLFLSSLRRLVHNDLFLNVASEKEDWRSVRVMLGQIAMFGQKMQVEGATSEYKDGPYPYGVTLWWALIHGHTDIIAKLMRFGLVTTLSVQESIRNTMEAVFRKCPAQENMYRCAFGGTPVKLAQSQARVTRQPFRRLMLFAKWSLLTDRRSFEEETLVDAMKHHICHAQKLGDNAKAMHVARSMLSLVVEYRSAAEVRDIAISENMHVVCLAARVFVALGLLLVPLEQPLKDVFRRFFEDSVREVQVKCQSNGRMPNLISLISDMNPPVEVIGAARLFLARRETELKEADKIVTAIEALQPLGAIADMYAASRLDDKSLAKGRGVVRGLDILASALLNDRVDVITWLARDCVAALEAEWASLPTVAAQLNASAVLHSVLKEDEGLLAIVGNRRRALRVLKGLALAWKRYKCRKCTHAEM